MTTPDRILQFWRRGEPWVWVTSAALTLIVCITFILIGVVAWNGLRYFWPERLVAVTLKDGSHLLGAVTGRSVAPEDHTRHRVQFKIANRDLFGQDFRWIDADQIRAQSLLPEAVMIERLENGKFYGLIDGLELPSLGEAHVRGKDADLWPRLLAAREALEPRQEEVRALRERMAELSRENDALRRRGLRLKYEGASETAPALQKVETERKELDQQFERLNAELISKQADLKRNLVVMRAAEGTTKALEIAAVVRATQPNQLGFIDRMRYAGARLAELLFEEPREANTEGGQLPAIFGTVTMVLLMSCFSIPLGVIAAIYLREYAKEGLLVRMVRIAVNNLAGVPSIVYGVFGLGFFVYGVGGLIDRVFYPELGNTPVFGTGGVLWASLTLALLTVPVVIVATEESLAAVPRGIREGSLALGATKFQTLLRILLPLASPGIMTGLILAMARAAGEVAPLMLVGVVKSAPALPLDGSFPFIHLDRKFMHLAFAIFDSGFQSPNVEAARPMVFVTTLLLLLIVISLSAVAILLRNKMRRRYSTGAF